MSTYEELQSEVDDLKKQLSEARNSHMNHVGRLERMFEGEQARLTKFAVAMIEAFARGGRAK